MKFKTLSIENYKSFQDRTDLHFPNEDDSKSIFLIGGMNGAGKTSIMEAINICLYGAKQEEIFRLINRKERAQENWHVSFELTIEMDNGDILVITRTWDVQSPSTYPTAKNLVERLNLERNGVRVPGHNKQNLQDYIRAIIPPGITPFFFFDGEKIQEIAADDHSEVRLKNSLEDALGLQYITQLSSDVAFVRQEARKEFVEISDEDMQFKEIELKQSRKKLENKRKEYYEAKSDLDSFKERHKEAKKRFQAMFNRDPEAQDTLRNFERLRVQANNRITQIDMKVRNLCETVLPFSLAGCLFDNIKRKVEDERESSQEEAIKENAVELARRIVRVVEEPEPIYNVPLSPERMKELETRIYRVLRLGNSNQTADKVLNLSGRAAAKLLNQIEMLESSDVFSVKEILEEKRELLVRVEEYDSKLASVATSDSERELFEHLQADIEGMSTQVGRKTEQLRTLEEQVLDLEKREQDIEIEIEQLYVKHTASKEKIQFIEECAAVIRLLDQYVVGTR